MIIRRRTYKTLLSSRYGYFMRNFNYYLGVGSTTLPTNIYTKCMLKEPPIGNFPTNYRTGTSAKEWNGAPERYVAVGETDGSVIYVVTAKNVYKSTNAGASFSLVVTNWHNSLYVSAMLGPIVYVDASYLYILYSLIEAINTTVDQYTLYLVKIDRSNNAVLSRTNIDSGGAMHGSSGEPRGSVFSNDYGPFFSLNVSPRGLVMFLYMVTNGTTGYRSWKVYDLPRGVKSAEIKISNTLGNWDVELWLGSGQWFDDGSAYGKFFFCDYTHPQNSTSKNSYTYKTVTASAFSAGASLTVTDIRSSLGGIVSDHISGGSDPRIFIASCLKEYKNKLFIWGIEGYSATWTSDAFFCYTCTASFGSKSAITINLSLIKKDTNNVMWDNSDRLSGIFVTPDGNYGCVLWNCAAIVFDLVNKTYFGGYDYSLADGNGVLSIKSDGTCFMLPKESK